MQEYLIFTQKGLYEYFGEWKMELFPEKVSKHIGFLYEIQTVDSIYQT